MKLDEHLYVEDLTGVGELLTLALRAGTDDWRRERIAHLYGEHGDAAVRQAAQDNRCEPLVADALAAALGDALPDPWRELLDTNERRVTDLKDALRTVVARLEDAGCPSALVESAGVLFGTNLPLRAFCSGDFDLLVQREHWDTVCDAFEAEGFHHADRRGRPTTRVEYQREAADGTVQWLEVGFAPFDRMWLPLHYEDRCETWLSRRRPSKREGADDLHVLAPADALVFVAFHTSLHSFIRAPGLRLHVDVDRLVQDHLIDWAWVMDEIDASHIRTRAYVSLAMARGLLGTPVPEDVLDALDPGPTRRKALFGLLTREGVLADGAGKLGRAQTVLLDVLLDDRGVGRWAAGAVAPDEAWMRSHFDREGTFEGPAWKLHLERARALVTRWRPR